jgi:hypothetical protein
VIQETKKEITKQRQKYDRAIKQLIGANAPLPLPLKESIGWIWTKLQGAYVEETLLRAVSQKWGIQRLDPNLAKSPHKHPIYIAFVDKLYTDLIGKGVAGYTAARLLIHPLLKTYGVIKDSTSPASLHRAILRRRGDH